MKYKIIDQDERYFAGIEHHKEIDFGVKSDISASWKKMFHTTYTDIKMKTKPHQMIGLNCNSIDFEESNKVTYYALSETIDLIEQVPSIITKKLPKGKYICFEVDYDSLATERKRVYDYCKKEGFKIHPGFDYENFLNHHKYDAAGAVVELCLMLEND